MRRIASHYIYCGKRYRMHYVELADKDTLAGIYPLTGEIAGTEFYDGVLVLLPAGTEQLLPKEILLSPESNLDSSRMESVFNHLDILQVSAVIEEGMQVRLVLLNGSPLSATELCTNDSRCNRHIQ